MKLALYSDLHLEIEPWSPPETVREADVVILAGDIGSQAKGLLWARKTFSQPVLYVTGNHEFYDVTLGLLRELRDEAREPVRFLEKDSVVIGNVRFLGCTLWSGFNLDGGERQKEAMDSARRKIGDYFDIGIRAGQRLEPRHTVAIHGQSEKWLERTLAQPFAGRTVVITHFAPHRGCIVPEHRNSPLNPYFVADMSGLMRRFKIDLWCHGHTHRSTDFLAENDCRVVSNQFGYPPEKSKSGFRPDLLIKLA